MVETAPHFEVELPGFLGKPGRLIAPQSFLNDRQFRTVEQIVLPPKVMPGGVFKFGIETGTTRSKLSTGRLHFLRKHRIGTQTINDTTVFDFRVQSPQNWAHFLNDHLPLYFEMCRSLGLTWGETLIVLPGNTPGYIRAAAEMFGLRTLATDDAITCRFVAFDVAPWTAIRESRATWARRPDVLQKIAEAGAGGDPLPRKVFLARRKTRALVNMAEVEGFLQSEGFTTIYPEDLSIPDQFRLFAEAETMVAIHGAGLAPLLYRPSDARLTQLVEIMPVGHMTEVFHVVAQQVGCRWVGVRGRVKSAYVPKIYADLPMFGEFSLDNFEVDTASLAHALALVADPTKALF